MKASPNVHPWDAVADGYAAAALPFFQQFSRAALRHVPVGAGDHIADIACGPGTLSLLAAAEGATVSAVDFSPNMLGRLKDRARREDVTTVSVFHADGQQLPFRDGVFDAAFSMFGLMFFPDRKQGYAELLRTLKPGAHACVASWAPIAESPLFDVMWQALRCVDPEIDEPVYDPESLENPGVLAAEMERAGFRQVSVHPTTGGSDYPSAEAMWHGLAQGAAPVSALKNSLSAEEWRARSRLAIDHIEKSAGPFPAHLGATALIAVGQK